MNNKKRRSKEKKKAKLTKFEEIKKKIEEIFPDIKTNYSYNPISKYYEVAFTDLNTPSIIKLSIFEDSKWIDIKKTSKKDYLFIKKIMVYLNV